MGVTCQLVRQIQLQRLHVCLNQHASKNRRSYTRPNWELNFCQILGVTAAVVLADRVDICSA